MGLKLFSRTQSRLILVGIIAMLFLNKVTFAEESSPKICLIVNYAPSKTESTVGDSTLQRTNMNILDIMRSRLSKESVRIDTFSCGKLSSCKQKELAFMADCSADIILLLQWQTGFDGCISLLIPRDNRKPSEESNNQEIINERLIQLERERDSLLLAQYIASNLMAQEKSKCVKLGLQHSYQLDKAPAPAVAIRLTIERNGMASDEKTIHVLEQVSRALTAGVKQYLREGQ
jgi:hypothetical protein